MNLKQITFWTMVIMGIVLGTDVFSFFLPIFMQFMVPNPAHWFGFVVAATTFLRDLALLCFFVFLYKRS